MSRFKIYFLIPVSLFTFQFLSGQSISITGTGYDRHTELNWNPYPSTDRYQIWRKEQSENQFTLLTSTRKLRWIDWTGRTDQDGDTYDYFIEALNVPGAVLAQSDTQSVSVTPFTDHDFLDMVQEYTLRYFYEYGHPVSGMARERLGSNDIVTTGGTGFGVMALITGIHRGFISREEGVDRMLKIVSFLQFADRFHGVFPHWMNGQNGDAIPFSDFDNGGDLVETAFLMQGLLCARQYFNENTPKENVLRDVITSLWEDVEWDFYSRNNSGVLYWHWSPDFAWQMNFPIRGYNEALIVYMLAIASPTHPVDASYWHSGWAGAGYVNGNSWYGNKLFVGPHFGGPLFFAHYSYMGFDPRNIKDSYANYFDQNRNHTLINRGWCIANPLHHEGYGDKVWGLTASDNPWGYKAHAPGAGNDNGTITPAAAIPSMPYTPEESLEALIHFYTEYGQDLWGEYGFRDAFNPGENWFATSYLAIDQGPIINMIENFRSGLLWSNFMANPEITTALGAIGFVEDAVSLSDSHMPGILARVYPTVSHGDLYIEISRYHEIPGIQFLLTDILGRKINFEIIRDDGLFIQLRPSKNTSIQGWVWVTLTLNHRVLSSHPVFLL